MSPRLEVDGRAYRVEALLFDKDGTLFGFAALWGGWATRLLDEVGRAAGVEAELGPSIGWDGAARRYDPAGPLAVGSSADLTGALASGLYRAGVPWHRAKEVVVGALQRLEADFDWAAVLHPVAGLPALLGQARAAGLPVAVLTADDTARARHHLELAGLADHVRLVIGDDAVRVGKPDPEPVHVACRALGVEPDQAALFGDTAGDVRCGRQAGVGIVVGVADTPEVAAQVADADHVIPDYRTVRVLG